MSNNKSKYLTLLKFIVVVTTLLWPSSISPTEWPVDTCNPPSMSPRAAEESP